MNFNEVKYLFQKEFQLELRKKSGINSILLFAVATTFISYLALDNIEHAPTWNALFWIIILFAFINAANNTFRNDTENTQGYLNQLAHPNSILAAKTLYNAFLMTITGLVNYFCYSLFIGNLIENQWQPSADLWCYIGTPHGQGFVATIGGVVRGHGGLVVFLRRSRTHLARCHHRRAYRRVSGVQFCAGSESVACKSS